MAAFCPNRNRRRRLAYGGGVLECRGRLEVHLLAPIVLPVKSMREPTSPERTLSARPLRSGVRIPAGGLRAAFADPALRDIACSACGWSLRRATAALSNRRRKKVS